MKILLSIKPQFVEKILSGEKKIEFRKTEFKRKNIDSIIVYSSGSVKKIVGEIKFSRVLCDTPKNIWKMTHNDAGISMETFMSYFAGRQKAFAIVIDEFRPYKTMVSLGEKYPGVKAPQSFLYLDEAEF